MMNTVYTSNRYNIVGTSKRLAQSGLSVESDRIVTKQDKWKEIYRFKLLKGNSESKDSTDIFKT